ncbi:MAG: hypothetical protein LBR43_02605 [Spiroplasmataceae bacterium]|jgi:hypothetical protein|nr:hypothetical protein [Spiroplasmataceae bacterium]
MAKEIIIIALIIVIIYLAYQQNQTNAIDNSPHQIEQLQQELKHYQTLYDKKIASDVNAEEKVKILEEQLKIAQGICENKEKMLVLIQRELKNTQSISGNEKIIFRNYLVNMFEKFEKLLKDSKQEHQEQLRQINLLFDKQAKDDETIAFNDLYSLLKEVAERTRKIIHPIVEDENKAQLSKYYNCLHRQLSKRKCELCYPKKQAVKI